MKPHSLRLLTLAVLASTATQASVTRTDVVGGTGGRYFEHTCATGSVLIGARAYAGLWLDNIQAVCARMEAAGPLNAAPSGQVFGGAGGQTNASFQCPSGSIIAGSAVLEPSGQHVVGRIVFSCVDAFTLRPVSDSGRLEGNGDKKSIGSLLAGCPAGTIAVGIRGRAGTYLDAFGLICDTPPSVQRPVRTLGKKQPATLTPQAASGPSPFGSGAAVDTRAVRQTPATTANAIASECRTGFVPRLAAPNDRVCVPPESQQRTALENARAPERRDRAGAYGPDTCVSGFVWREAYSGDVVCVTPEVRALVRQENSLDAQRRAR